MLSPTAGTWQGWMPRRAMTCSWSPWWRSSRRTGGPALRPKIAAVPALHKDTELQVVIVGSGRADLVAQPEAENGAQRGGTLAAEGTSGQRPPVTASSAPEDQGRGEEVSQQVLLRRQLIESREALPARAERLCED